MFPLFHLSAEACVFVGFANSKEMCKLNSFNFINGKQNWSVRFQREVKFFPSNNFDEAHSHYHGQKLSFIETFQCKEF